MWNLVFCGDLVTGFQRQEVVENLASLLRESRETVAEELFTGTAVTFRQVDSEQEAQQWRTDFARAGALLMVLPDESEPGGGAYAGADPANTDIEEPTPRSVTARLSGIRRRNYAFMVMGAVALVLVVIIVVVLSLGRLF
ncbi:hypothetical protein [Marinimicrobium sp. ABcell2]|uniref:hypothetical protein n=1 Tax=Marinimicrobium sp. ABcell2 TaxID=3069751 RepID=UPI0027B80195|nr:hypothetical protein [Marinimicrobium sp. ABcell2]MDQ2075176.1 hypothetical protein [Marinimicrobium sp. ABcell2]